MPRQRPVHVTVNDKMQHGYEYDLTEPMGKNMEFEPALSPAKILQLGAFEGKYCRDCADEFPTSWFKRAKFAEDAADVNINYFGLKSRMSLPEWRRRHWIVGNDPRGWFQWYMRYYMGRRDPVDAHQIARYKAIARHAGQVKKNCKHQQDGRCSDPLNCRPRQRQTLLQWAWDPFI